MDYWAGEGPGRKQQCPAGAQLCGGDHCSIAAHGAADKKQLITVDIRHGGVDLSGQIIQLLPVSINRVLIPAVLWVTQKQLVSGLIFQQPEQIKAPILGRAEHHQGARCTGAGTIEYGFTLPVGNGHQRLP